MEEKKQEPRIKKKIQRQTKIHGVYENIEDYNPTKKRRVLIVLHDMIADMESNRN